MADPPSSTVQVPRAALDQLCRAIESLRSAMDERPAPSSPAPRLTLQASRDAAVRESLSASIASGPSPSSVASSRPRILVLPVVVSLDEVGSGDSSADRYGDREIRDSELRRRGGRRSASSSQSQEWRGGSEESEAGSEDGTTTSMSAFLFGILHLFMMFAIIWWLS